MQILQLILSFFLYSFGIAIAFIDLLKENYRRESILKDEYLKNSKEHYQNLKNHISEVQKIRHDMKNHLQLLEIYIKQKDWEKAHNYLKEIENHQQWNYKPLINIGNDLVNAVLNSGLENIDPEIAFKVEGVLPPTLEIQEFDLCTIFSNLLSNSIEACGKLKEQEKIILLSIRTFQNQMVLSFKNPIEEDIKTENLGKFSTKKDRLHHGYGILNIMDAVEKYGGTVDFLVEDNWFEAKICLYLTAYS
ncbi:MAG: GHKL domain-containing protein [Roseburia sp.]|nr:GHKL domain-containing protein [Roseburia sp.]